MAPRAIVSTNSTTGARSAFLLYRIHSGGLEPPPGFPDTDLNRARLPIPPRVLALDIKSRQGRRSTPVLLLWEGATFRREGLALSFVTTSSTPNL